MAIQTMTLDPNAVPLTPEDVIAKINTASGVISRAASVNASARPIVAGEISNTELSDGAAKDNLDEMSATARGYIKTEPGPGEFKIVSLERASDGKLEVRYDDVAEP